MAKQLLLYVEGNRAIFCGGDLQGMQQIDFPPDIVRDLDVINKEKLYALFQASIEAYQLIPTSVTIILSTLVTFDKDISEILVDQQNSETQKFLDQVPFQETLPYRFTQQNKQKIIAANKDFVYSLKTALEKRSFTVACVASLAALQEVYPELATNLNFDLLISKIDSLKQYNMLISQDVRTILSPQQRERQQSGKTNKKELYILLGVFGVLIIVLIIVAVINLAPQKPAPPKRIPTTSQLNTNAQKETAGITSPQKNEQPATQNVEGISIYRPNVIIPTFYTITTGR